jgi:homoserine O-acetyltransferase/O-succinyltransferase
MSHKLFTHSERFQLEGGQTLPRLEIAYHSYGTLNPEKDNVVWVCHALTANSDVLDWWAGLFGKNNLYDPKDYFIVCANNLGSCYGSTGPLSTNADTRQPWLGYFPQLTIKDTANAFALLREHLGIKKIHTLIGGSQGGQIAQEIALQNKSLVQNLILIATNAQHSPWGIAFNESQRLAIKADRTYYSNLPDAAQKGLAAARSIALLSYRGYATYQNTQNDNHLDKLQDFAASAYQRYQGQKLVNRFNAYSYVRLLEAMDSHNVARNRTNTLEDALSQIKARTLVISITSDILFPTSEQKFLAEHIPAASFVEIDSAFGHDGFLIETEQLTQVIKTHFKNETSNKKTELTALKKIQQWQKN